METGRRTVKPPLRGVYRGNDHEAQPELTTPDARDVLPFDCKTGRTAIATRPGWSEFGDQANANLIATLNIDSTTTQNRLLITAADGTLYKWAADVPTVLGSGITTGRNVAWAPYIQRLFIANDGSPKVYDHSSGVLSTWTATDGVVPTGCQLICEWANRLVLAGNPVHSWYMARIDDPFDWLYAADDAASPVAATDIEGGQLGAPMTALVPHNRDCLLMSTANTISVVRGNPVDGGYFERVSNVSGITNKEAWCKTSEEWTYMMTRKGLAKMPPGCGDYPQLVSHEIIPDSLKTVDGISRLAYLAFDVLNEVVHIHVSGDVAEYWLFDVKYGGFWPVTSPGTSILAMHRHDPLESDTQSGVLIGTAEGLMRLDSDVAIGGVDKAYVQLGPSRNDQSLGEQAILQKSVLKFADTTDDLDADVKFYAAENCETVCDEPGNKRYATKLKNFANGHAVHPRVAGQANLTVITQGDTSKHFAFEEESDYLVAAGRERGAT